MLAKSTVVLTFLLAASCAAHPPTARHGAASQPKKASSSAEAPAPTPNDTLARAEETDAEQLGAMRGGRIDTERQVMMLEQAVALYQQFIERAEGKPEMEAAVCKSRERIADARDTLVFLRASLGAPPPAPAR